MSKTDVNCSTNSLPMKANKEKEKIKSPKQHYWLLIKWTAKATLLTWGGSSTDTAKQDLRASNEN